jgi:hypothetical protein
MKRIIRLTESDLTKIVKRVITEQTASEKAKKLYDLMKGVDFSLWKGVTGDMSDNEKKIRDIINSINTQEEWDSIDTAFGNPDGQNLMAWLKDDMPEEELTKIINNMWSRIETNTQKSSYKPGTTLDQINNHEYIMGRAYTYASTMGDREELNVEMRNVKVLQETSDSIIVKAGSIEYYDTHQRERGKKSPDFKMMYNTCVKIPKKDISGVIDGIMKITWFADTVINKKVACPT